MCTPSSPTFDSEIGYEAILDHGRAYLLHLAVFSLARAAIVVDIYELAVTNVAMLESELEDPEVDLCATDSSLKAFDKVPEYSGAQGGENQP